MTVKPKGGISMLNITGVAIGGIIVIILIVLLFLLGDNKED